MKLLIGFLFVCISVMAYAGEEVVIEDSFTGSSCWGKVSHFVVVSKCNTVFRTYAIRNSLTRDTENLTERNEVASAFDVVLIYLRVGYKLQNIESIGGSWKGNRYFLVEKS